MSHSKLACSSMQRLTKCLGSLSLPNHPMPDNDYTLEGTRMHNAAERGLTVGRGNVFGNTPEEFEHLETYWNRITMIERFEAKGQWEHRYVEQKFESKAVEDFGGTADYALVSGTRGWIVDLKWGKGQFVNVNDNQQLMAYATLLYEHHPNLEEVTVWIVQPRMDNMASVTYSAETLRGWLTNLQWMLKYKVEDKSTGDHCGWCPAITSCPAVQKEVYEIGRPLNKMMDSCKRIAKFAKEIPRVATETLLEGGEVEGYKLVMREGREAYVDEARVLAAAKQHGVLEELTNTKLKTPAQIRALGFGWLIEGETVKPDLGAVAVPVTDSREEIYVQPINDFEIEE